MLSFVIVAARVCRRRDSIYTRFPHPRRLVFHVEYLSLLPWTRVYRPLAWPHQEGNRSLFPPSFHSRAPIFARQIDYKPRYRAIPHLSGFVLARTSLRFYCLRRTFYTLPPSLVYPPPPRVSNPPRVRPGFFLGVPDLSGRGLAFLGLPLLSSELASRLHRLGSFQ